MRNVLPPFTRKAKPSLRELERILDHDNLKPNDADFALWPDGPGCKFSELNAGGIGKSDNQQKSDNQIAPDELVKRQQDGVVVPREPTNELLLALMLVKRFDSQEEIDTAIESYKSLIAAAEKGAK